ncbi:MAG: DUF3598 domain-containing protein [Calothrix sp. MO_167.B42]|nr:DUF3598 domain-containing protein [Calothrix sp. MO_167.B42]
MSTIKQEMPVLTRHEGDWVGTYTVVDAEGKILDKYKSHLTCEFPEDGSSPYFQTNRYSWENGKVEEYDFPGMYADKKLLFDTERIQGEAWEVDDSTVILRFTYKEKPGIHIVEMIYLSPDNNYRSRTWHWFNNGKLFQRTLIQEERMVRS